MQKFKEAGNLTYISQKELDKAQFQNGMVSRDFKGLTRSVMLEVLC